MKRSVRAPHNKMKEVKRPKEEERSAGRPNKLTRGDQRPEYLFRDKKKKKKKAERGNKSTYISLYIGGHGARTGSLPDPLSSAPTIHERTPRAPQQQHRSQTRQDKQKTHVYISLTGSGPEDATTGPFHTGVDEACSGHWAVQSRGWRCGPRTAVPPLALPHSGWKLTLQSGCEQAMSPPDFLFLQKGQ